MRLTTNSRDRKTCHSQPQWIMEQPRPLVTQQCSSVQLRRIIYVRCLRNLESIHITCGEQNRLQYAPPPLAVSSTKWQEMGRMRKVQQTPGAARRKHGRLALPLTCRYKNTAESAKRDDFTTVTKPQTQEEIRPPLQSLCIRASPEECFRRPGEGYPPGSFHRNRANPNVLRDIRWGEFQPKWTIPKSLQYISLVGPPPYPVHVVI